MTIQAKVGDLVVTKSRVGTPLRGEIIEVRGIDGAPPYLVRFEDGHETLVYPGPETEVISAAQ